jgi:hypothetical protein
MPIVDIQRRMMELGRVRLGDHKGAKTPGKPLKAFRFTSASPKLLEAIAEHWGGKVQPWAGAPEEGLFEVFSEAGAIDIVLPPVYADADGRPTVPYSQWYELWSGGGCQRRCDGVTEGISGEACLCNREDRACNTVTRVSFMLPDIPGLGVWRLESHGYNAAVELPGTLEVLSAAAAEGKFIPAVLRIDARTRKVPGQGPKRFIVPVIELQDVTIKQLASGDVPLSLNAPQPTPPRPELPAGPTPEPEPFEHDDTPGFGTPPPLPNEVTAPEDEPEPLTKQAFDAKLADAGIPYEEAKKIGSRLFPGKAPSKLNQGEYGRWWAEVEKEGLPA